MNLYRKIPCAGLFYAALRLHIPLRNGDFPALFAGIPPLERLFIQTPHPLSGWRARRGMGMPSPLRASTCRIYATYWLKKIALASSPVRERALAKESASLMEKSSPFEENLLFNVDSLIPVFSERVRIVNPHSTIFPLSLLMLTIISPPISRIYATSFISILLYHVSSVNKIFAFPRFHSPFLVKFIAYLRFFIYTHEKR